MKVGILGAVSYESILEHEVSGIEVKTQFGDYIRMCERFPTTVFADNKGWFRANMDLPFCPGIRSALVDSARAETDRTVHDGAINICVQGPYNETPAEIELHRRWGADIVCTTIYPEVVYFRELEMCFAGLSWLSDVAGVEDERDWVMITAEELAPIMSRAIGNLDAPTDCRCQQTWAANDDSLPEWYRAIR